MTIRPSKPPNSYVFCESVNMEYFTALCSSSKPLAILLTPSMRVLLSSSTYLCLRSCKENVLLLSTRISFYYCQMSMFVFFRIPVRVLSCMRTEQVTTLQERRPTLIFSGAPSVQHLHLWPASHHLQKVCAHRAVEAVCWLRLGCCSNNAAKSHLSPGAFDRRVRHSCLVPQCSHPPHRPRHQRCLANCDWMLASYTSKQSSNRRRHPTCWTSSQWSHTVSSTPCHEACTSAPLSVHLFIESIYTAPQIETPTFTRRRTIH